MAGDVDVDGDVGVPSLARYFLLLIPFYLPFKVGGERRESRGEHGVVGSLVWLVVR